jgi:hypothetical protein
VKSLNSSGHKRSRLPVVQAKPSTTNNTQFSSTNNKFGFSAHSQYPSTSNTTSSAFPNSPSEHDQPFTRRNLFQPHVQHYASPWTVAPGSEDGVESQGQESVRKFCTEDTPISLSKAGSNTNLSSLTFDDDDYSTTGHMKQDIVVAGEPLNN